ncbi:MAG: hypothetical protein ACM3PT_05820 [Deltaproteobacteria bacterium]
MKNSLIFKLVFILPVLVFVDYLLMVILGCATCLFGFGDNFYCGKYCLIGKIILFLSAIFFIYLIYPDVREIVRSKKNATTQQN